MLEAIGVQSVNELFASIPEELRLKELLRLPRALTELELTQHIMAQADRNLHTGNALCFLGGGAYDHFIPAVVDMLVSRGEFYTSYTPYQPEVSQGNLQAMFEYQSLICQLTGMDVSNASLYDGGSATAEAVLMALSVTGRSRRVVVAESVHPEYRQVVATYLAPLNVELAVVKAPDGAVTAKQWEAAIDAETACVLVQHPNFFGCLEDVATAAQVAHHRGALCVQIFDPISLGLLKRPAELGADIAVAEGQSLGTPLQYGGPYLGILACREPFLRRLPGRIAGQTVDRRGRRCWVLTLQTREQHIRREKATSNICTNQGLMALRATIYLALLGPQGLREVANLCLQKSHYAYQKLLQGGLFQEVFPQPFFKEFVVRAPEGQLSQRLANARQQNILAGVPLSRWYPERRDELLVCVTEKRTRQDIDAWVAALHGR
jgi:glycine dehydrogenase subunit 1